MSTVYKGSIKGPENKDGKSFWNPSGHTLFVGEYEGKPSINMVDSRGNVKVTFFPVEREKKSSDNDW